MRTPLDFLNAEEWKGLQGYFASVTGITSVTFDLNGEPIFKPEYMNEFCPIVKGTVLGQIACKESHRKVAQQALANGRPMVDRCHLNMVKVVVPIIIDGEAIGVTGGCGVLPEGERLSEDNVRQLAMVLQQDFEEMMEKSKTIKNISDLTLQLEIQMLEQMLDEKIPTRERSGT